QHAELQRLADRENVDYVADGGGQGAEAGFDGFDQAVGHDRVADPSPHPGPLLDPPVGDLLLDDVAQIQGVAAGEVPQPVDDVRFNRSVQGGRQQLGDLVDRQRLDVEPVELAALPYVVDLGGDLFTVAQGQYHFGGIALDDLVQDERRQFVQQLHI